MTVDTPARLLRLLAMFTARATWNADELAGRLEITTRTLRRDVTRLRDLGYPIASTTGRYGGYELGAGGRLPPLLLDEPSGESSSGSSSDGFGAPVLSDGWKSAKNSHHAGSTASLSTRYCW